MQREHDACEHVRTRGRKRMAAAVIGLVAALFSSGSRAQSRPSVELLDHYKSMTEGLRGVAAVRLDLQVETLDEYTPKAYSVFLIRRDVGEVVRSRLAKTGLKVVDNELPSSAVLVVRVDPLGTILQEGPREPTYRVQLVVERRLETVEGPVHALVYEGPVYMVKTTADEWKRFANRAQGQKAPGDMFLFALDHALDRFSGAWEGSNRPAPGKQQGPSSKAGAARRDAPRRSGPAAH